MRLRCLAESNRWVAAGTYEQIKQTCKLYRVYFSTPPDIKAGQDYLVDHSIYFYLMGTFSKPNLRSLLGSYHYYIIALARDLYLCGRQFFTWGEPHACRGGLDGFDPPPPLVVNSFLVSLVFTRLMVAIPCPSLSWGRGIWIVQLDPEGDFVEALGKQHTSEQAAKIISDHVGDWKGPLKR